MTMDMTVYNLLEREITLDRSKNVRRREHLLNGAARVVAMRKNYRQDRDNEQDKCDHVTVLAARGGGGPWPSSGMRICFHCGRWEQQPYIPGRDEMDSGGYGSYVILADNGDRSVFAVDMAVVLHHRGRFDG